MISLTVRHMQFWLLFERTQKNVGQQKYEIYFLVNCAVSRNIFVSW